jgi:ADP-heptose:LPS heptosyltransferase
MTKTVYVSTGGGLGDAIYDYFIRDTWRMIEPLKRNCPEVELLVISLSHCSSTLDLVQFNPLVSARFSYPWNPPGNPREFLWKQMLSPQVQEIKHFCNINKISPDNKAKLYLSKQEEELAKNILDKPIIVVHPFAGGRNRSFLKSSDGRYHCLPEEKCVQICNRLSEEGNKVVVLGKSEVLEFGRNYDETLIGLSPEVINLSNKISARLSVYLTQNAIGFFGTHSSMLVAAWTADVPSLCFYPTLNELGKNHSIETNGGHTGTFALHKPIHQNYQMSAEGFNNLSVDDIYNRFNNVLRSKK